MILQEELKENSKNFKYNCFYSKAIKTLDYFPVLSYNIVAKHNSIFIITMCMFLLSVKMHMLYFTYTSSYVGIMFGDIWSYAFFMRRLRLAHFLYVKSPCRANGRG